MSDTPETDAARHDLTEYGPPVPCSYGDWVAADFALKLERERDKARNLVQSGIRAKSSLNEALDKTLYDLRMAVEQNAKLFDIADRAIQLLPPFTRMVDFGSAENLRAELDQLKEGAK